MRALFGWLAVFLGAISIALAARYGYKGSDTLVDSVISAVVFGAIALCAFLFDAAAVRLWFLGHRLGATIIGLIATAALIVTFTNSLGAIAARDDTTLAERTKAANSLKDDRADLNRLRRALDAIGPYASADAAAVSAAKRSADTATSRRIAECGPANEKRGPLCKVREEEEAKAAEGLKQATAAKATTDRAAKIEAEITAVRLRLGEGPSVHNPNPLGAALEAMLGVGAAALTAWQKAIVAGVFELCLVGVMVIFELLGQGQKQSAARGVDKAPERLTPHVNPNSSSKTNVRKKPAYDPPREARLRCGCEGIRNLARQTRDQPPGTIGCAGCALKLHP
jgi:hypothetical protein